MNKIQLNSRVQYLSGGAWRPTGTVVDVSPAITMEVGGRKITISSEKFCVRWDDQEEGVSGWLTHYDLRLVNHE